MSQADPNRALSPDAATLSVSLPCYDENFDITAPPEEVLELSIIGSLAFVRLSRYEETATSSTTTRKHEAMVDARALLLALANQMGVAQLVYQHHPYVAAAPDTSSASDTRPATEKER